MKLANERKLSKGYVNPDPFFIVPKALYFLLNWLVYSPHAYIFQFIGTMWGLSKAQLNFSMLLQIFNFLGAMYWGALADRTRKYKLIAAFCVIMNTVFVCAMAFPILTGSGRYAYFLILTAGQCFFSAGTFPMIDAIVLSALEADPSAGKDSYGYQKAFGTIAHNVNASVIHYAYEHFGQDFFVMYYSAIGSMLALVLTLLYGVSDRLKIKAHKHHAAPAGKKKEMDLAAVEDDATTTTTSSASSDAIEQGNTSGSSTWNLIKQPKFLFFLASILASGVVRSVNTNNHSVYLTEYLKLDKAAVGSLMLWGRLLPEIGLLFFAKTFMSYIGPYWFLILGQFAGLLRISLYLFLEPFVSDSPPYNIILIFIEMLKGANSSMVSASAFRIASDLAPPAWSGAAQTLVAGVWQGVSMALAAIIATVVLIVIEFITGQESSDENLFWVFAVTTVIGAISFIAIFFHYSVQNPMLFKKKN